MKLKNLLTNLFWYLIDLKPEFDLSQQKYFNYHSNDFVVLFNDISLSECYLDCFNHFFVSRRLTQSFLSIKLIPIKF